MDTAKFGLPELVQPLATEEFFAGHWEQKPLHIARDDPGYYDGLFSTADVDALLSQSRPRYPQLRVVNKYKPLPAQELLDAGWLNPVLPSHLLDARTSSLYGAYSDGYTLIVELEKLWRPVSLLCRRIEELLHHRATAELYLTPQGAQGFDLHFDHHEVFILQLEGAKRWLVYDPVKALPVTEERPDRNQVTGDPVIDTTLEAGGLLYIPRGFLHEGATSDQFSMHITFGVFVYRWKDLLDEELKWMTERDVRFRESLPMGLLRQDTDSDLVRRRMRELLEALLEDHDADPALERLRLRFLKKLDPAPDGHFQSLNRLPGLSPESQVEKRVGSLCHVSTDDGSATIHFPGGFVKAPGWVGPALDFVCRATGTFTVAALPDALDTQSKLVLVRRLVKEGLLRFVGP